MRSPTLNKNEMNDQSLMLIDIDKKLDRNSSYFGKKFDTSNRRTLAALSTTQYWDLHPYVDVGTPFHNIVLY